MIRVLESTWPGSYVQGRAFAARGGQGDSLVRHPAIALAQPGDVIVADVKGEQETAHCGDLLARAALARGIAELDSPIFHDGASPRGPAKHVSGELGTSVERAGVVVRTGDLGRADDDGVVVIASANADSVVRDATELAARELDFERRIAAGESTVGIFDLQEAR